jgi:hypothetical protein
VKKSLQRLFLSSQQTDVREEFACFAARLEDFADIKDHLIPQVASKNTPKEMFDALTRMHEGKNIKQKMNLRT